MEQKSENRVTALLWAIIVLLGIIAVCEIHREFVGLDISVELLEEEENEN